MAGIFKNIVNTVKKAAKDTGKAVQKAATDTAKESVRVAKSDLGQAVLLGAATGGVGVGVVAAGKKIARTLGGRAIATTVAKPKEGATAEAIKDRILTRTVDRMDDNMLNQNRDKPREVVTETERAGDLTTAPVTRAEVRKEAPAAGPGGGPFWKQWWVWLLALVAIAVVLMAMRRRTG